MNVILISAIWGLVMMFSGIFIQKKSAAKGVALLGALLLLGANIGDMQGLTLLASDFKGMLLFDRFGHLLLTVLIVSLLFYFLLSANDIEKVGNHPYEYFTLIFFVFAGIGLVTYFNHLLILFLGIEIISIPLYILTGTDKRNLKSNEASLKYFLMGAFSTGIMLMGIALLYGAHGTFRLEGINMSDTQNILLLTSMGVVLMLIAMSFKVSAAPFHFWTPDVYDGAPTVFTGYMATIVKVAGFIAFLRLFENAFGSMSAVWQTLLAVLTALTLFVGNITAVFQQSVKRMLAYSSIAQAGFMMLAVFAVNDMAKQGLLLYAAAYCLATLSIFAVLAKMKDYTFEGFNGFAKQQPLIAGVLTISLFSLAGIPLTAGFFAKYFVLAAAVKTGFHFWLIIFAVLMAAVSVYYYFRLVQAMYFKEGEVQTLEVSSTFKYVLFVMAMLMLLLGLFPHQLLLNWFTLY